jgi:hypothetical protein
VQFTDPTEIQARARAVYDLVPAAVDPALVASNTRVVISLGEAGYASFNAVTGAVTWADADGVSRVMDLPAGVTSEAVAAILFALAEVRAWA